MINGQQSVSFGYERTDTEHGYRYVIFRNEAKDG